MSEPTEPPAAVEPGEDHHQRAQEHDKIKDVSGDSSSLASTEIVGDERDEIRGHADETTDPYQSLEFNKHEVEIESSNKDSENQVQEVIQEKLEQQQEQQDSEILEEAHEGVPAASLIEEKIEDESMPSLVSSRIDESELNVKCDEAKKYVETKKSSPNPSPKKEESDDDSVCVIDDDDDDDDEGARDRGRADTSLDEGSSSLGDSDDMDEDSYDEDYSRRDVKRRRDIDIEDDEEDEDEDEMDEGEGEEEDVDNDSNPDDFDGGSDDLVLRHRNGLAKRPKERSASLQDLNLIKGESPKKRRSVNPFNQRARNQFPHVESKVKKYIADIGEQRRKSFEQRRNLEDESTQKTPVTKNETETYRTEEVVTDCNQLKIAAEKTFKELADSEKNEMYITQSIENGEISIFSKSSMGNGESDMKQEFMEVDPIQIEVNQMEIRIDKVNGSILEDNEYNHVSEKGGILRRDDYSKPVANGEVQINSGDNSRSLTYDEYMTGSSKKKPRYNEEVIDENEIEEIHEVQDDSPVKCNVNQSEATSGFRIENVTSNYYNAETVADYNNSKTSYSVLGHPKESYYPETPEAQQAQHFRLALEQRNSQFDSLRDAYQRTLSDNMAMKIEIEKLKKVIFQYTKQDPTVEKKSVSSQTEYFNPAPNAPTIQIESEQGTNRAGSLNSAMTSTWSDMTGSIVNSSVPPHLDTSAFSSDAGSLQSKLKQKNPLSRAFITSTRILRTLSNITHGKSKPKYSKSFVPEAEASSSTQNEEILTTNSRKRKATEAIPNKPFKIPHIAPSETENQNSGDSNSKSSEPQSDIEKNPENKEKETTANPEKDLELEDVKVFEYEDDDDGAKSFLIQANELSMDSKTGVVKECGPYLLGNMEVYMTEKDGTINIWGKEIGSVVKNDETLKENTSVRSNKAKADIGWQSTPRLTGHQASSGRRSRTTSKFSQNQTSQRHSCDPTLDYENCSSHRVPSCSCNHYCRPHYNYGRCMAVDPNSDPYRYSLPDVRHNSRHGHSNQGRSFTRRHSFSPSEDEEEMSEDENVENSVHSDQNDTLVQQPSNSSIRKSTCSAGPPSYENEQDPLIFQRPRLDEQEGPKGRSSKKRVKGILMNMLKGCGDCRQPALQPSMYEPSTSTTQKGESAPSQPPTNPNENSTSGNQADIANQLNAFRAEIERLSGQEEALRKLMYGTSTKDDK